MIVDKDNGIILSDSTTNLLVYWVGHCTHNSSEWADQSVRADEIGSFFIHWQKKAFLESIAFAIPVTQEW